MRHDPILLASARRGDFAAMEQLLALCRPDLRRAAQRRSSIDPERAVQRSLHRIYRRNGALRTVASFAGWTYAFLRGRPARLYRRIRRAVASLAPHKPVSNHAEPHDLCRELAAAIQSLPDKYREAIILRDFEEFSITEIADQVASTRAAVKSRIHRGRQMVQEYLKD